MLEPSSNGVRGGCSGSSSREDGGRGGGGGGTEGGGKAGTEAESSGQGEERNGTEGWMSEIDRQLDSYVNSALQKVRDRVRAYGCTGDCARERLAGSHCV